MVDVAKDLGLWAAGGAIGRVAAPVIGAGIKAGGEVLKGAKALKDIGVKDISRFVMAAADPAGAQAAGNLTRIPEGRVRAGLEIPNSEGIFAAILRNQGRHRSANPFLGLGVKKPQNVDIDNGRAAGVGSYFATTPEQSRGAYGAFGKEEYRIKEPLINVWNTIRNSPGYATGKTLQELSEQFPELIGPQRSSRGMDHLDLLGRNTEWDDPVMKLLQEQGYLGYRYADNAFTDWTVGSNPLTRLAKTDGTPTLEALANKVSLEKLYENVSSTAKKPVDAIRNATQNVSEKIRLSQRATENAYKKALREYGESERDILKNTYGPQYNTNPSLMPPRPPGYTPAPPPQKPGMKEFLRYLFGDIPYELKGQLPPDLN
jgi:hypothetical protein